MSVLDSIVEAWFSKAVEIYPQPAQEGMRQISDRFRNPVAFSLRESLAALVNELTGDMSISHVSEALDAVLRVRAVQNCTPDEAIAFTFRLGDVIREQHAETLFPDIEQRISSLKDCAREQYAACRKDIAQIRSREGRRLRALEPWMRQAQ